jgi:hypothetical protein
MDEDQFVTSVPKAWWLVDPDLAPEISGLRAQLGAVFGWSDASWYQYPDYLRAVFEEIHDHADLFLGLDETMESPSAQAQWLGTAVAVLTQKRADAAEKAEAEAAHRAQAADRSTWGMGWSEDQKMLWHFFDNAYWWAYSDDQKTARPGTEWMSLAEVEHHEAELAEWNEGWGMLQRLSPRTQTWEFAYSDDQKTVRDGTDWMSPEEAERSRSSA